MYFVSEESRKRDSRSEGQLVEIAAKLKMPAAEANRKIGNAKKTIDALTYKFVRKDLPSRVGGAVKQDFPEAIPPEELANQLGITLRRDKKQESGTSRQVLFGSIGQSPVVLSTCGYGVRGDFVDDIGRTEVWVRAIANEIPEVGQVLWPIVRYGNFGRQTYFVEPEVQEEQFLGWGGPESMITITRDLKRHPEAIRAFFSCFTQAIQFLKATETPVKGGKYLLPRDFAKFGGNAMWESYKSGAGQGKLRIRDLGQWQLVSGKTPDREIITRAYQWAAINQFLGTNIGGVFGTYLKFSESGKGETVSWTDSRFRSQKPYSRTVSKTIGKGADISGFIEEWNKKISPLIQRISMSPVELRDESLPEVPGYSGLVFTGSPIELIEGVLKSYGLWFPRGVEPEKDENSVVVSPEIKKPKRRKKSRGPRKVRQRVAIEAETILTAEERDFGVNLENLVVTEKKGQTETLDAEELQMRFAETRSSFYKLSVGSRLRSEVMKGVFGQLAEEGEMLKKAGKTDAEIFEEWLKRVFIPLYKRTKKKL